MVLPLNGFGFASLILISGCLLLCANGTSMGIISGVAIVYTGIE